MIKSLTREEALDTLVQLFKPADLHWLWEQLDRLLDKGSPWDEGHPPESYFWDDDDDEPLPESATFEEATRLFLADKCSLGRAAELAGVTRWDIQRVLKERRIPIVIETDLTVEEMDQLTEELEREGLLRGV